MLTTDRRIPPELREELHKLLQPGETIRRPKRWPVERAELVELFEHYVHLGWTYRQTYAAISSHFHRTPRQVIRILRSAYRKK